MVFFKIQLYFLQLLLYGSENCFLCIIKQNRKAMILSAKVTFSKIFDYLRPSAKYLPKVFLSLHKCLFGIMAKDAFKTYIWLLDTIQRYGRIKLVDLKEKWLASSVNDLRRPLADRTFKNYRENIEQIFDIVIKCDRATNEYFIDNEYDLDGNSIRDWMLNSLSLRNLLNESAGLHDRILLEDVPSSHRFLTSVIDSMRDNKKLCISYKGHSMTDYKDMVIHPYSIRLFKRRWYLIAYSEYSKGIRLYMLDRAASVNVLDEVFEMPEDFDAEGYFEDFYGVRRSEDDKQRVLLKVNAKNRDLVRTVALHRSQEEIETNDEYSVFKYFLRPNFDFKQEIISYLDSVEVLEPLSLRKEIGRMVLNVYMKYREDVKR